MFHAFATFTARHPEFHRLLSFEGQVESERLNWLLETYVRPYYEISIAAIRAAQQAGVARPGDPGRLHYAVVGIITTSIVFEKEYSRMTGLDPLCSAEVEQVVNLACALMGSPSATRIAD
jgi:hypothetical protein